MYARKTHVIRVTSWTVRIYQERAQGTLVGTHGKLTSSKFALPLVKAKYFCRCRDTSLHTVYRTVKAAILGFPAMRMRICVGKQEVSTHAHSGHVGENDL